jgi:hypothetical protein
MVSLKDGDEINNIALINGNKPDFTGPIILLDIDQDVVYGLSHREVVSRIYKEGPQILLTTKDMGHKLYEHGMKASLGRVKVGNVQYTTNIETFYTVKSSYGSLSLIYSEGKIGCYVKPHKNYTPILIASSGFIPKGIDTKEDRIDIEKIRSEITRKFSLYYSKV